MPVSAQCLFANYGLEWDILEIELKEEGWLQESENLWDVLAEPNGLSRQLDYNDLEEDPFDETWTEEDYINFYNNL